MFDLTVLIQTTGCDIYSVMVGSDDLVQKQQAGEGLVLLWEASILNTISTCSSKSKDSNRTNIQNISLSDMSIAHPQLASSLGFLKLPPLLSAWSSAVGDVPLRRGIICWSHCSKTA